MPRFNPALCLLISALFLLGCSERFITPHPEPEPQTPITAPTDQREYRAQTLDNGLQVLLISDPLAEKAAASMNVAAGSWHEPDEWPGLAHFLEHMLFLGTELYPQPDAYQQFIRQHGGRFNAFTAPRDTNYFFDIRAEHLEGALSQFSRFFIDPLFTPGYVAREVQAVHAEWSSTLQDDGRRRFAALREALNPEHPASRFSAGNRDSLDVSSPELIPAMRQFHEDYYHPDRMSLVIFGPQSLDTLAQYVARFFTELPQRASQADPHWPSLVSEQALPKMLEVRPLRETYVLQLHFPIRDPQADYRDKPLEYLSHLITHEAEGSLLAQLRALGWVQQMFASGQMGDGENALFTISFELTPEGDQHLDQIEAALFAWLAKIEQQGIEAWRFDELRQLAELAFNDREAPDPSREVTHLSMRLRHLPPADWLRSAYLFAEFNPSLIHHYLQALTPDKRLRVRTSPAVETTQTAPWLPVEYQISPLSQTLKQESPITQWRLPPANPFIPSELALLDEPKDEQPRLILQRPGLAVWQGVDDRFSSPRAQVHLSLQNPEVLHQLDQRLLARLAAEWLDEALSETLYFAGMAGTHLSIDSGSRGLSFTLSGYQQNQARLLQAVLEAMQTPESNPARFERLKNRLLRSLNNQKQDRLPQLLVRQLYQQAMTPFWSLDAQIEQLESLTEADLADFFQRFPQALHVQMLGWGQISESQLLTLVETLEAHLPSQAADSVPLPQIRELSQATNSVSLAGLHNDHGILTYWQGGTDLADEALLRLIAQLQSSEFFHQLRTEQQLGYAVFADYLPLLNQAGLFYFVQSPEADPAQLENAVEQFLNAEVERLTQLTPEAFAEHQASLVQQLRQPPQRLAQAAERHWQEILHQRYAFDRREAVAQWVEKVTQAELVSAYQRWLNPERQGLRIKHQASEAD